MTFEELTQAMCQQIGIDIADVWAQQESGSQTASFVVAEHLYSLFHSPFGKPQVIVRGDIGPLPEQEQHLAFLELLQLNAALHGEGGTVFGADPGTNRIIVLASLPLDALTAQSMLTYLESLAGVAERWSKNYLFSTAPHDVLVDPGIELLKASLQDRMERSSVS